MPSLVRPDRPDRWWALACEMGSIGSRCTFERALYRLMRAVPVSTTYRIPGTVRLVSATLVARTMRLRMPAGARSNTRCCSAALSRPYSGSTSVPAPRTPWRARCPVRASAASRISFSPLKNTSTSPSPSRPSSSTAAMTPSIMSMASPGVLGPSLDSIRAVSSSRSVRVLVSAPSALSTSALSTSGTSGR